MKLLLCILFWPCALFAQLEFVSPDKTPLVFSGEQRIGIIFKNPTDKTIAPEIRIRLFQASSATLVPTGEPKSWKRLQVLPGQTVIENLAVTFPPVHVITEFRLRLSTNEKRLGDLKIRVVPDDVLKQLSALAEKNAIGILDPDDQLKPILKRSKIRFHDLETGAGFDDFEGKLAIIGPFRSKGSVPVNLEKRIAAQRAKPFSIVWIQPPETKSDPLLPVYFLRQGEINIAVVQPDVVSNLAASATSQLNLVHAAELALKPELLRLSSLESR